MYIGIVLILFKRGRAWRLFWSQLAQDNVRWLHLVNAVMDSSCSKGEEYLDELRNYHLLKMVYLAIQTSTLYKISL
jgi:hypothetical protein